MTTREELLAKHARELAAHEAEQAILSALPEWAHSPLPNVFIHSLWGCEASATWEYNFYRLSSDDTPQPDLAFLLRLAEALPALPIVQVRDGCLSFRLKSWCDALPEDRKARWESEMDVSPFLVEIGSFQQQTATVQWFTHLAGRPCEVKVVLPLSWQGNPYGTLDVRIKDVTGGRRVEKCEFRCSGRVIHLVRGDEPLAEIQPSIRWASGSPDVPNRFTLYWCDLRDDIPSSPVDLARALLS